MLSSAQKRMLDYCHSQTSIQVQAWIDERRDSMHHSNPWAEEQLRAFLKAYDRFGSGVAALRYLEGGDHEQLKLLEDE